MEKIIEKLYELHVKEEPEVFTMTDREKMQREYDTYLAFSQILLPHMREELREYVNLNEERHKDELQKAYTNGFKAAIKLVLEGIKE
jgi:hypothetical protein